MWTGAFWKAASERAVRTFAQALAAVMVADGLNLLDADWTARLSAAAGATLLSFLTSIVASGAGNAGPSLANETVTPEPAAPAAGYSERIN
jgi:hypothetical protein